MLCSKSERRFIVFSGRTGEIYLKKPQEQKSSKWHKKKQKALKQYVIEECVLFVVSLF